MQSSSSIPDLLIHVFMNPYGRGRSKTAFIKSMTLSTMSWYADALRVPLTGTKMLSPTPEKQPTP